MLKFFLQKGKKWLILRKKHLEVVFLRGTYAQFFNITTNPLRNNQFSRTGVS